MKEGRGGGKLFFTKKMLKNKCKKKNDTLKKKIPMLQPLQYLILTRII